MSTATNESDHTAPSSTRENGANFILYVAMWVLWAAGVGITMALVWQNTSGQELPGCKPGEACDMVLSSQFSQVLGLSLTTWAMGYYIVMAIVLAISRFGFQMSLTPPLSLLLPVISSIGVAGGIWSMTVMAVYLKNWCLYCTSLHAVNLVIFILSVIYVWQDWQHRQFRRWQANVPLLPRVPLAFHGALACLLVVGQLALMSFAHKGPDGELLDEAIFSASGELILNKGENPLKILALDAKKSPEKIWTYKGARPAKNQIVMISCLTCPKCKQANRVLSKLAKMHPNELRIDIRFYPLWHTYNDNIPKGKMDESHRNACELARFALAMGSVAPEKSSAYINWLYENQEGLTLKAAKAHAHSMVDGDTFDKAFESNAVWARFRKDQSLCNEFDIKGVPKIYMPGGKLVGGLSLRSLEKLLAGQFEWTPVEVTVDDEVERTIQISGRDIYDLYNRAKALQKRKQYPAAVDQFEKVIALYPDHLDANLSYAMMLSTCPDKNIANGEKSLELLKRAKAGLDRLEEDIDNMHQASTVQERRKKAELKKLATKTHAYYSALSMTYATTGDFGQAVTTMKKAVQLAVRAGDVTMAEYYQSTLTNKLNKHKRIIDGEEEK